MVVVSNSEARKLTVAALLVAVSILAFQPSLARAIEPSLAQSDAQPTTLTARGYATPMSNSAGTAATNANIYLTGSGTINGGNIILSQLTGILQIGPVFYKITGGEGQTNDQTNVFQLNLQVGGSQPGTLVLVGTLEGNTDIVLFTPQQSNLESQYSLWLYGIVWQH